MKGNENVIYKHQGKKRKNSMICHVSQGLWRLLNARFKQSTAWKVSKYKVFHGPYLSVFKLNKEIYSVNFRIQSKLGKYRPEKPPYLETFHTVISWPK